MGIMMKKTHLGTLCVLTAGILCVSGAAQAQSFMATLTGAACRGPAGSLRIVEPDDGQALWANYGLSAPTRMLRVLVQDSKCFTVIDRGAGFAAAQAERELIAGGHMRSGSNIGAGQMTSADFVLIPEIISSNPMAGGSQVGVQAEKSERGLVGGLMNVATLGISGKVAAGMSSRKKTAQVGLTLVDVRTSEQIAAVSAEAKLTDRDWNLMAAAASQGNRGGISAGSWENTEFGKVIQAAYKDAYNDLIREVNKRGLLVNRIESAPQAMGVSAQVAMTTAYPTGGSPTHTASQAPAHASLAFQEQQMQQLQQLLQAARPAAPVAIAGGFDMGQLAQVAGQLGVAPAQLATVLQQSSGQSAGGADPGSLLAQLANQLGGQGQGNMAGTLAQVAGAALGGQGQGNMAGTLAQVAGAALGGQQGQGNMAGTLAQVAGAALGGQQGQGNMAGTLAQVAGAALGGQQGQGNMAGTLAQVAGAALGGQQGQGNMAGTLAQVAGAALGGQGHGGMVGAVQQFAGTAAASNTVLVLKVPANFMADASGAGSIVRVLQPGETLARLAVSPQGNMLQVRDNQGVIGWIQANTHADQISISQ